VIEAIKFHGDIRAVAPGRIGVLPAGSVESHGPHGYLGVDSLIASHIAEGVAERLDGILLPRVDYTWCPEMNRPYAGTISIPQAVMEPYFEAVLAGVLAWGVSGVLAICGHNGNLGPLSVAADLVGQRFPDQFVVSTNWWETWPAATSTATLGFTERGGHGHGGPLEMSAAWAVYPAGVDVPAAQDISVAQLPRDGVLRVLHQAGPYPSWDGYQGLVSEASRSAGQTLLDHAIDQIVREVNDYRRSVSSPGRS
jgi:creatinine amidohydrolase